MLDFNRKTTKALRANAAINEAIDTVLADNEPPRSYLGASAIGHDCLRKIQWDWREPAPFEARTKRIFARGKWIEIYAATLLARAGFRIRREGNGLSFSQLNELFKGHVDGVIEAGPDIPGMGFPALWECKGLGSKGWKKLKEDGLVKAYPGYADQVALYQAYLNLTHHPALFTAVNMDTMEMLHLLVPFDAARAQSASDRAVQIVLAVSVGEILPRVTDKPEDFRCKWCAHRARCWDE